MILALVLVLAGGAAFWSARAGDEPTLEQRFSDIERRLERIEGHLFPAEAALSWTPVSSVEELRAHLTKAADSGTPVVVATWADWCVYSKACRELIENDSELKARLQRVVRLLVDATEEVRSDLCREAGLMPRQQPQMAFYDARGQRVDDAAIRGWKKEDSKAALQESLGRVLPE